MINLKKKVSALILKDQRSIPMLVIIGVLLVSLVFMAFSEFNTQPNRRSSLSVSMLPFATFCSALLTPFFYLLLSYLRKRSAHLVFNAIIVLIATLLMSYGVGWVYFHWTIDLPFIPEGLHGIILQELISISMPFWIVIALLILLIKFRLDMLAKSDSNSKNSNRKLAVSYSGHTHSLGVDEIAWAKAEGNYVKLFAKDRFYLKHTSLKTLLESYEDQLVRIHKSFLVNLDFVESYKPISHGDLEVRLTTGETVKCSRNYTKYLKESLVRAN